MDISWLTAWLKTTIPGIILLGALGSILAVFALKLIGPPLRALVFRPLLWIIKQRAWRYWRASAAYTHIERDATNRKLIYYLFYHLARLLVALAACVTTTVVFSVVIVSRSEVLLTYGTFVLSTLAFLSGYWAWMEYENITINFFIEWRRTGLVKDPFPDIKCVTATERAEASKAPDTDGTNP